MPKPITDVGYRALAEFRYRIRLYLESSEKASHAAGLEHEQYQLLLAVRGMPLRMEPTVQALANRLRVRNNTVVERLDRLAGNGHLRRLHSRVNARIVFVELTARSKRKLGKLARHRLAELRETGSAPVATLAKAVAAASHPNRRIRQGKGITPDV